MYAAMRGLVFRDMQGPVRRANLRERNRLGSS